MNDGTIALKNLIEEAKKAAGHAEKEYELAEKCTDKTTLMYVSYEKALSVQFALLKDSAERGFVPSIVALAKIYWTGNNIVEQDRESAIALFTKAAEKGDGEAMYCLGEMYTMSPEKNLEKAVEWYRKAKNAGHEKAAFQIAYYLEEMGRFEESFRCFKEGAESGDMNMQFRTACDYESGIGVEKDIEEAVRWFTLAAEQGHEDAKLFLESYQAEQSE